jgi:hypothetical protein
MLKPQTRRVLDELRAAGSFGRTRVDFLHTSPPVLNLAARILELRSAGYHVVGAGRRHGCKVYRLAGRGPVPGQVPGNLRDAIREGGNNLRDAIREAGRS